MLLENVMSRRVITINADENVTEAAIKMKEENVGCLVVVDKEENITGVVTDRDIMVRVIGERLDPDKTAVKHCMTKDIVTAIPQTDVLEAARVMNRYDVRRLPIVDGKSVVGIVSMADIAVYAEGILGEVSKMRKR